MEYLSLALSVISLICIISLIRSRRELMKDYGILANKYADCVHDLVLSALRETEIKTSMDKIIKMETPSANATVRRMVKVAKEALENDNDPDDR